MTEQRKQGEEREDMRPETEEKLTLEEGGQSSENAEDGEGLSEPEELGAAAAAAAAAEEERKEEERGRERNKLSPEEEKIEELTDRLKRSLAEFDNYRKRTEKEKTAMFDLGAKSVWERLLPVVDNFERSLAAAPDMPEVKGYADGMEMIYRQLLKNMEEAGVAPMDPVGKSFDPEFHNALLHVEDGELEENIVVEELQKGYMYKDSVLRHSMVKVAN